MTHALDPFPKPSAFTRILIEESVFVARLCYERGWSYGTAGNFSVREKKIFWQSPSGWCKGSLKGSNFIPLHIPSGDTIRPESAKPSLEMPVHLAIYKQFEDARTVVHTHPIHLVAASMRCKDHIVFEGMEMQKALGKRSHLQELLLPIFDNVDPDEMRKFADINLIDRSQCFDQSELKCIVLKGHGVYAWGSSPTEALAYIEALEHLSELHLLFS